MCDFFLIAAETETGATPCWSFHISFQWRKIIRFATIIKVMLYQELWWICRWNLWTVFWYITSC